MNEDLRNNAAKAMEQMLEAHNAAFWEAEIKADRENWNLPIEFSNEFEKFSGYSPEESPQNFRELTALIHPDDKNVIAAAFRNLIEDLREALSVEFRFRKKNGSAVWCSMKGKTYPKPDGSASVIGFISDIDEKVKLEHELATVKFKYDSIVASTANVTYEHIVKEKIIIWSEAVEKVLGFTRSEMGYDENSWLERVHPDDLEAVHKEFDRALRTDGYFNHIYRFRKKDGGYIWMQDRGIMKFDEKGELRYVYGALLDVDDETRQSHEIKDNEERLRELVRNVTTIVWTTNPDGAVVSEHESWEEFTGQTPSEYKGGGWTEAIHPEDREETLEKWRYAVETKSLFEVRHRLRRKDGEYRIMTVRAAPILDESGNVKEWVGSHYDVTERITLENQLAESERKYRALTESLKDNIFVINTDFKVEFANKSAEELFGRSIDAIIGKPLGELFPPTLFKDQKESLNRVFQTGEALTKESSVVFPRGTLWLHTMLVPIKNSEGKVERVLGASRDLTEHKKMEEAIKAGEVAMKSMMNAITETFAMIDSRGKVIAINQTGAERFGKTPEELVGKNILELLPEPIYTSRREKIEQALRTQKSVTFEDTRAGKTFLNSIYPAVDPDGKADKVTIFALDISNLRKIEENLKVLEHAIKQSPSAFSITNLAGNQIFVNPAFVRLFGFDLEDDALNSNIFELVVDPEDLKIKFKDLLARGKWIGEIECKRADGEPFTALSIASVVYDDAGNPICLTNSLIDISERKIYEKKLADLVNKLRKSNKELEQFAYVASHDLQEPLRGITSSIQIIEKKLKDSDDEELRKFLKFAVLSSERMKTLISDLLVYSRVQAPTGKFREVDINEVVEDIFASFDNRVKELGAEIIRDKLPVIVADEPQMYSLFRNLIGNSLKFASDEPLVIRIGYEDKRDKHEFSITDTGIGFNQEYADKIFQIFKRLHSADDYPGTGIGLAVCKKIVERHGGSIGAESSPRKGAAFRFTISKDLL